MRNSVNHRSLRTRLTSLAASGVVLAGFATTVAMHADASVSGTVAAAHDFASDVWSDPWDYNNAQDILLDPNGPTAGIASQHMSSGLVSFDVVGTHGGYVSPLWTGIPHSLQMGQDGSLGRNTINAGKYTNVSFQMYASGGTSGAVFWFSCAAQSSRCEGGKPFSVRPGWNTYSFRLSNDPRFGLPAAWSGAIHGLRIALNRSGGRTTHYGIDWLRLYQPSPALQTGSGPVSWAAVPGDGTARTRGVLNDGDASALPPGNYTIGGTAVTIASPPMPNVLSPDASGDALLPTGVCFRRGMNSPAEVAGLRNIYRASFTGGRLNARNYGPTINDPQVWLKMPSNGSLDGRLFHRVLVTFKGDLPFNLADTATGGTHGRIVWYDKAHGKGTPIQTKPWVTYNDRVQTTFDMHSAPSALFEESRGSRYPWGSSPIIAIRWDPNEARGSVPWHLIDIRFCEDSQTHNGSYAVRWSQATAGTATLDAVNTSTGAVTPVGSVWAGAGTSSFTWTPPASLKGTRQWIRVTVNNGVSDPATATSTGPLWVR
jgi:hypothetical protein